MPEKKNYFCLKVAMQIKNVKKKEKKAHAFFSLLLCLLVCAAKYHFSVRIVKTTNLVKLLQMFTFLHLLASFPTIRR